MSEDKYAWTPSSDLTVDEFVKKVGDTPPG